MVTHLLLCHVFQSHPKQFCNLDSNVYEEHLLTKDCRFCSLPSPCHNGQNFKREMLTLAVFLTIYHMHNMD